MSTAIDLDDMGPRPEPKRDRWGRYLITPAGGGKAVGHTRATTVAEVLDDRYNLELWKMRQVAVGLAARPDLLAQVAAHTPDDKQVLNGVCTQAMDAAASQSGANLGTALHRIVERVNRGELTLDTVPEMFRERVAAYFAATSGLTVRRDLIERVAVLGSHTIAGMFDIGVEIDGRLYVADLKTGSGIDFGARGFAVQLAIYANAETLYDYRTDTHEPAPGFDRERAIVIHLPSAGGPCELHWLDIAAGAEALEHAVWTRSWRKRRDLLTPFPAAAPAAVEPPADPQLRAWVVGRIQALPTDARATLGQRWPADVPTLKASDTHTEADLDAIAAALDTVERDHDVPFGDLDPRKAAAIDANAAKPWVRRPRPAVAAAPLEEGPLVTDGRIGALKASIDMAGESVRRQLQVWGADAQRAGVPFSTRDGNATERRYAIIVAALDLATVTDDDDLRRTILGLALGDEVQPAVKLGAALGALDPDAAAIVSRICAAVADGSLTVDGDAVIGAVLPDLLVGAA